MGWGKGPPLHCLHPKRQVPIFTGLWVGIPLRLLEHLGFSLGDLNQGSEPRLERALDAGGSGGAPSPVRTATPAAAAPPPRPAPASGPRASGLRSVPSPRDAVRRRRGDAGNRDASPLSPGPLGTPSRRLQRAF